MTVAQKLTNFVQLRLVNDVFFLLLEEGLLEIHDGYIFLVFYWASGQIS
jgi:hypothetical protein